MVKKGWEHRSNTYKWNIQRRILELLSLQPLRAFEIETKLNETKPGVPHGTLFGVLEHLKNLGYVDAGPDEILKTGLRSRKLFLSPLGAVALCRWTEGGGPPGVRPWPEVKRILKDNASKAPIYRELMTFEQFGGTELGLTIFNGASAWIVDVKPKEISLWNDESLRVLFFILNPDLDWDSIPYLKKEIAPQYDQSGYMQMAPAKVEALKTCLIEYAKANPDIFLDRLVDRVNSSLNELNKTQDALMSIGDTLNGIFGHQLSQLGIVWTKSSDQSVQGASLY